MANTEKTEKLSIGADTFLYPMPAVLVGATVEGRPNYLAVAFVGIINPHPPLICIALNRAHYTNAGIKLARTFSVNIPSADMAAAVDLCGMVSGKKADKSKLFKTFYGVLENAPMIEECPINMECRLIDIRDYGGMDELFVGEIVMAYSEEKYLTDGLPDMRKVDPLAFTMKDNSYWRLGERIGGAWEIGNALKDRLE